MSSDGRNYELQERKLNSTWMASTSPFHPNLPGNN